MTPATIKMMLKLHVMMILLMVPAAGEKKRRFNNAHAILGVAEDEVVLDTSYRVLGVYDHSTKERAQSP